jgi:hypothetical protein
MFCTVYKLVIRPTKSLHNGTQLPSYKICTVKQADEQDAELAASQPPVLPWHACVHKLGGGEAMDVHKMG